MLSLSDMAMQAAIAVLETEATSPAEKVERLIDIAHQLQHQSPSTKPLENVVYLYCQALELCEQGVNPLLQARVLMGLGSALRGVPSSVADPLIEARAAYEKALPLLQEYASPWEIAEAEMNLGLVFQALIPYGLATLSEAVHRYQRALRTFTGEAYPKEHAILQNNLAIAYLSMPPTGQPDDLHQDLAIQAFEQALGHINQEGHPQEYALLQNNLGNALQYMQSDHWVKNQRRALKAYDEALKVRTAQETPLEYAHTLSNKANVLFNLPDDDNAPEAGNCHNLASAKALYEEARSIFQQQGQVNQAEVVMTALIDIESELLAQTCHPWS